MYMRRPGVESIYFDMITSIPFTWAEFVIYLKECVNTESPEPSSWSLHVQHVQYTHFRVRICVHITYTRLYTYISVPKCVNTEKFQPSP